MMKKNLENFTQKGSIMIEALALLGLITMVTPILYRKAAERTTELQDINIATQLRMISNAADNYIKDNYSTIGGTHSGTTFTLTDAEREKLKEYLPAGVTLDANRLFSSYNIGVRRNVVKDKQNNDHNIYTTSVLGALAENFTMMRSSKIASMIGANGGVYRTSGADSTGKVTGVQGIWSAELKDYGLASVKPKNGSLMVISSDAISAARGDVGSDQALYRVSTGDPDKNTMQTTLLMGGNPITQVTQLVASGDAVTIGESASSGNLIVEGTSNLKGAVTAGSGVTVSDGNLTVTKGNAEISAGNLTVTKGNAEISAGDLKVTKGNATIGGTLGVTGTSTLQGAVEAKSGVTVSGGNVNVSVGNLDVTKGNATIGGTLGVTGATTLANNLTVMTDALKVINDNGSKTVTIGAPLTVSDTATFKKDVTIEAALKAKSLKASEGITLGASYSDTNVKLTSSEAKISVSGAASMTSTGGAATVSGKTGVSMKSSDGAASVTGKTASVTATNGAVTLAAQASSTDKSKLVLGSDESWSISSGSHALSSNGSYLKFANTGGKPDMRIDDTGFALSKSDKSVGGGNAVTTPTTLGSSLNSNASVSISRDGIIEVAAPTSSLNGYIKARRLVSDVAYPSFPTEDAYNSVYKNAVQYDYYQVNPAYTSVMNDIKLATRGGARLSDILPDFINKGIYVLDNTYQASAVTSGVWPTVSSGKASTVAECTTSTCIASPWLGFVPTPQCPRNYARAITVNPIRWRMSEVYSVYQADKLSEYSTAAYKEIVSGDNFSQHFMRIVDPKEADFELSSEYGSTTDTHTHYVERGFPLTFQTNTFLNTSLATEKGSKGTNETFQGWHVLMGFLYRPGQYGAVLKDVLGSYDANSIYWNVFPVYAQNMAAFASVYCYFNRHPLKSGSTNGTREWTWGDKGTVDTYDQLNSFRAGFNRSSNWSTVVNDPTLGYTDPW